MPYQVQQYKKKKRYNKKPKSRGEIYSSAASQLYKDVSMLKGLINVEFKFLDYYLDTTYSTTATFHLLNGIPEGDDVQQRNGREIRLKSIQVSARQYPTSTTANGSFVRYIIFIDTQPNGTAPTSAILLSTGGAPANLAMRNLSYRKRFVILKDKIITTDSLASGLCVKSFEYYKKLNMHTIYSGIGSTISDITTNSVYMMMVSNQTGTDVPAVAMNHRIRFIDN